MSQVLHGSARTMEAARRAIQRRQESVRAAAKRYGISPTTIPKWRGRQSTADAAMGPKVPRSTVLAPEDEAIIVAFRRRMLLPLDDCLSGLQPTIPHLTRSCVYSATSRKWTMAARPLSTQLLGLDALRFASALAVLLFHFTSWSWLVTGSTSFQALGGAATYEDVYPWTWFGWVGVEVFFLISGFVIAYSAEHATGPSFFWARFLRLAPAAWICATITAVFVVADHFWSPHEIAMRYAKALMFWPMPGWIDGVYWTLGIEMAFYALLFLLVASGQFRHIGWLAAALGLISAGFWVAVLAHPPLASLVKDRRLELALIPHGCFFALGIVVWLCLFKGTTAARLGLAALALGAALIEIQHATRLFTGMMGRVESAVWPCAVFLACGAIFVLSVRWNAVLHARIGARGAALIRHLGLMTYPLYLLHNIPGLILNRVMILGGFSRLAALTLSIAAVVAASLLVSAVLEPLLRGLLRQGSILVAKGRAAVET